MTPEQMRVAIAKACGWRCVAANEDAWACWVRPGNNDWQTEFPPNYPADLNAMHEAEKVLTDEQLVDYAEWLGADFTEHPIKTARILRKTALQRAEAFCKTLNLKVEDDK